MVSSWKSTGVYKEKIKLSTVSFTPTAVCFPDGRSGLNVINSVL